MAVVHTNRRITKEEARRIKNEIVNRGSSDKVLKEIADEFCLPVLSVKNILDERTFGDVKVEGKFKLASRVRVDNPKLKTHGLSGSVSDYFWRRDCYVIGIDNEPDRFVTVKGDNLRSLDGRVTSSNISDSSHVIEVPVQEAQSEALLILNSKTQRVVVFQQNINASKMKVLVDSCIKRYGVEKFEKEFEVHTFNTDDSRVELQFEVTANIKI